MFVKRYGSGCKVVFCLHGWSGNHRSFDPLVRYLPEGVRLESADLPGYGRSPAPRQWKLDAVSAGIERAFADADAQRLTVVGNCLGGLLGMTAALRNPRLVHRLVLIDTFAQWPWYFKVFAAQGWGRYAYASTFANPVGRWLTNRALASKRSEASDLTESFAAGSHETTLEYLRVLQQIASPQQFASLDVPVDVVFGSRSFRAVKESAEIWRSVLPRTRIWELPGAGHLVVDEAAAALSEIIFGGGECGAESVPTLNSAHR